MKYFIGFGLFFLIMGVGALLLPMVSDMSVQEMGGAVSNAIAGMRGAVALVALMALAAIVLRSWMSSGGGGGP